MNFERGFIVIEAGEKHVMRLYVRKINTVSTWKCIMTQKCDTKTMKNLVKLAREKGAFPINLCYQPYLNPH